MKPKFVKIYLVCIDLGEDVNYVVARNPSIKKARKIAERARGDWPQNVYITMEMVPEKNPQVLDSLSSMGLDYSYAAKAAGPATAAAGVVAARNPFMCQCGAGVGECIGNLHCQCVATEMCKRVTNQHNPLAHDGLVYNPQERLWRTLVRVVKIGKGVVEVVIPEWNPDVVVGLQFDEIPRHILRELEDGTQFHVKTNIGVKSAEDLIFREFELDVTPAKSRRNPYQLDEDYPEDEYYEENPEDYEDEDEDEDYEDEDEDEDYDEDPENEDYEEEIEYYEENPEELSETDIDSASSHQEEAQSKESEEIKETPEDQITTSSDGSA